MTSRTKRVAVGVILGAAAAGLLVALVSRQSASARYDECLTLKRIAGTVSTDRCEPPTDSQTWWPVAVIIGATATALIAVAAIPTEPDRKRGREL